jgi:hypothetical protein
VLVWLPRGLTLPKPDKRGWWPHGLTRIESARHPIGYIAKYASKGTKGHALPRGSRVFAVLGLDAQGRRVKRWWCAPGWVRSLWPDAAADVSPAPGGGWVARATGEWHPSPWVIRFADGRLWAVQAGGAPACRQCRHCQRCPPSRRGSRIASGQGRNDRAPETRARRCKQTASKPPSPGR